MAYATIDELAVALRITVTAANQAGLQACLDAAAFEIDDAMDRLTDTRSTPPTRSPTGSTSCAGSSGSRPTTPPSASSACRTPARCRRPGTRSAGTAIALLPHKQLFGVA